MTYEAPIVNFSKWQSQQDIDAALREKTIAVVGLSSNPTRPSHDVAHVMQRRGYRIVPINPRETRVLDELCYPDLATAAAATGPIRLVNVFRESNAVPAIARGGREHWRTVFMVTAWRLQCRGYSDRRGRRHDLYC